MMMDSAAYFLVSPPSSTPSPGCLGAAASGGSPTPLAALNSSIGSLGELDFVGLADHNHNHLHQQHQRPLGSSSSPFINYAEQTSSFVDPFDLQHQHLQLNLHTTSDFFNTGAGSAPDDDDDDRHLCQAGLGSTDQLRCESPSLIGMDQFGCLLGGATGDDIHAGSSLDSAIVTAEDEDDACSDLLAGHHPHHLSSSQQLNNQDHNHLHHHHHHRTQLHSHHDLQHQQQHQQNHLNHSNNNNLNLNHHHHHHNHHHHHLGGSSNSISQGFQSQDNLSAFVGDCLSGSLSSGSSNCSLNLGVNTGGAGVYDDPADIISSNSNDFYSNYYNLNDCLQSDMSLTSHQQQQYTNNNNNFFNSTNTAASTHANANANASTGTSTTTTTTTEKRSVLMNLLLDGSDIGAGYTSINCRALRQNCSTTAAGSANIGGVGSLGGLGGAGFLGSTLYSNMD